MLSCFCSVHAGLNGSTCKHISACASVHQLHPHFSSRFMQTRLSSLTHACMRVSVVHGLCCAAAVGEPPSVGLWLVVTMPGLCHRGGNTRAHDWLATQPVSVLALLPLKAAVQPGRTSSEGRSMSPTAPTPQAPVPVPKVNGFQLMAQSALMPCCSMPSSAGAGAGSGAGAGLQCSELL